METLLWSLSFPQKESQNAYISSNENIHKNLKYKSYNF